MIKAITVCYSAFDKNVQCEKIKIIPENKYKARENLGKKDLWSIENRNKKNKFFHPATNIVLFVLFSD